MTEYTFTLTDQEAQTAMASIGTATNQRMADMLEAHEDHMVFAREVLEAKAKADRVEVAVGDVEDRSSLAGAVDGVEAAYYLIHLMDSGHGFVHRDRQAAENFVAVGGRLKRVIYLGGLLPDAKEVSDHLSSRAEVGQILRDGLPTVEFRAGPVIGSGSASFEMVRYLTERLPAMVAPKWILNDVQPIAVRDILRYLVAALDRGAPGVYNVGADPMSFKAMMQVFAEVRGLKRLIVPVPVLAAALFQRFSSRGRSDVADQVLPREVVAAGTAVVPLELAAAIPRRILANAALEQIAADQHEGDARRAQVLLGTGVDE